MNFIEIYLLALALILIAVSLLWITSVIIKNVSIIDLFWGFGFVLASLVFFLFSDGNEIRKVVVLILVSIWGIRLSGYLTWRNCGKEEDYRYQEFRKNYGASRYWWFSFFQVFLLQGVLIWLVSAPLLAAMFFGSDKNFGGLDLIAIIIWVIGFIFEAGGDFQLSRFKSNPQNKGKVLQSGLWKYTRHPNYFGDATVWWAFALFGIAAGSFIPVLSSLLMTALIIKVSGVAMLEKTISGRRPEYNEYIRKTSVFIPWFPKK